MGRFDAAEEAVMAWKAHIIRGVQQETAKWEALQDLAENPDLLIIISDWSMKWLPSQHLEKQSEWFGKRGISIHVDVILTSNGTSRGIENYAYVTAINEVKQNVVAVLSCFENVLKDIAENLKSKKRIILRSDNAGCYHSLPSILAKREIAHRLGFTVIADDFCEPQRGKDQADRVSALVKSRLRSAIDAGQSVISAEDMRSRGE
jgi:hypothetical protein